jgi:RimJ/RimL family protein N-acetyltransferase
MQPATIELQTRQGLVSIRPTREEDAANYRELRLEALRTHPTAFGADYAEDLLRPAEQWQQNVRDGAGGEQGILYVAESSDALIGMTGVYRRDRAKMRHHATIWGVYVRPEWRGAHIADTLIEACVAWSREQQLRVLKLSVVTSNAAAIQCYVRCGFSVYGLEPEAIYHDSVYYDELLMWRRL